MAERCPDCGHRLNVVNSKVRGDNRVRYLGCSKCGKRPERNKRIVPLEFAPGRG